MKMKPDISFQDFLNKVRSCSGEVVFTTPDGDLLNLKSTLSQFIFAVAVSKPELTANGKVVCSCPEDYKYLAEYLMEEQ